MGSANVFLLNPLMDLPSIHSAQGFAGDETAELYFLDFDPYSDRSKAADCLTRLAREASARGLDFSTKTLLVAARGLVPLGRELLELVHRFRTHHVFFELWNEAAELQDLLAGRVENLYFLPVTSHIRLEPPPRIAARPNRNVFVSLGGDDDLDLVRDVIARCPDLSFFVPTVTWVKNASNRPQFLAVRIPGANVTPVDCSRVIRDQCSTFSPEYLSAYGACDTMLLAIVAPRRSQMRGGLRIADALRTRRHMVIVENPMCQLSMARDGETCLVAAPTAASVAEQLTRICQGGFQLDAATYEEIRELTTDANKLAWMIEAALDPARARRSVFACSRERLAREVERLAAYMTPTLDAGSDPSGPPGPSGLTPMTELFDLAVGTAIPAGGGASFVVRRLAAEARDAYRIECELPGGGETLSVRVLTSPTEAYAHRTKRGHYLICLSSDLSRQAGEALRQIAALC